MKTVLHRLCNDLGTDLNKSLNFMGQARLATQAARGVGLSQFTLCFISTHENTVGEDALSYATLQSKSLARYGAFKKKKTY